jgi:putative glutamine amidotransferase
MDAPIVGITGYPRDERGRFSLPAEYVAAVRRAGGIPVIVAPGETRANELLEVLDALILAGGGDVDPMLYGGRAHPAIYGVDRERDESEIALAREVRERGTPALAICRGSQVLNVALGGTLIEHLPDEVGERVAHRGSGAGTRAMHAVEIEPGSGLARTLGSQHVEASSSHHQGIRRVARELSVVARAEDGAIEGVELPRHPFLLGVQWHPEHTAGDDPAQQRLFDDLVEAARRTRSAKGTRCD